MRVSDVLTRPETVAGAMFTVDHPTNQGLETVVAQIHAHLGLSYAPAAADDERLGDRRAPLEPGVLDALHLAAAPRPDWWIKGEWVTHESLLAAHLAWYNAHRELLPIWLEQHDARLRALSLGPAA